EHGPPWVPKTDNGSTFTGTEVAELLAAHRVAHLLSPPHWPRYNGAIEAGIHGLKDRTAARAARAGHPGDWTSDDLAGALTEAAELARPRGLTGPSPTAAWLARSLISADERTAFTAVVAAQTACGRAPGAGWSAPEGAPPALPHALPGGRDLQYPRGLNLP